MRLAIIVLLLCAPALAGDGIHMVFSWLMTGGPIAPFIALYLAYKYSPKVSDCNNRWFAKLLTIPATGAGYYLAFETAIHWPITSAIGFLFGPFALLSGALLGILPSALMRLDPEVEDLDLGASDKSIE